MPARIYVGLALQDQKMDFRREAPSPLPAVRKRSLTLPLRPKEARFWEREREQKTAEQLQSSFFGRFPLEIRELIYKYYLAPDERCLHVFRRTDKRLGHYRCTGRQGSHPVMPLRDWGYGLWFTGALQKYEDIHPLVSSTLLPLLKTCRKA